MIPQTEGIIVINEKRQHVQTNFFRSYTSFPTDDNATILHEKFSELIKLNDTTLAPQYSVKFVVKSGYALVLLPLVGAISCNQKIINASEIYFFAEKSSQELIIMNPYETEFVNFIEIWFKVSSGKSADNLYSFSLDTHQNKLVEIYNPLINSVLCIGKFDGRVGGEICLTEKQEKLIALNLSGSFELQDRLLHERDAVLLWNCPNAEFESLAPESILLVISG